jgi:tripartite ATP-independent transporter DctP family solute receptor
MTAMRKLTGLALLATVGMLASTAGDANAQNRIQARIAVVQPETAPNAMMWHRYRDLARERTGGAVELQVFAGGQLGGEKEMAEGMRLGSIQGADITLAALSSWVPEGQIFDLPFIFRDVGHVERVVNGPIGDRYKAFYRAQNFEVPAFFTYGARHLISRQPVLTVGEVRGKQMRVIQSPLHINIWRTLGANPSPIPITETYNALSTGVVDMMDITKGVYESLKLFEAAPNLTETGHIWAVGAISFSRQFWTRLTPEQQRIMTATGVEMASYINKLHMDLEAQAMVRVGQRGAKEHKIDQTPWRTALQPVLQAEAAKFGGMDKILEIVNAP